MVEIGADLSVGLLPDRHYQRGVWHRHLAGAGALPGAVNGFCVMRLKIHPMVATMTYSLCILQIRNLF